MTKKQAIREFREYHLPYIRKTEYNGVDSIKRREAFNNFTDSLCKEGRITQKQYNNWSNPF